MLKKCSGIVSLQDIRNQFGDQPNDAAITETITALDFNMKGLSLEALHGFFATQSNGDKESDEEYE